MGRSAAIIPSVRPGSAVRVGIDYQILALGPELITRGMGRYTQQQVGALLAADRANEYVLLCDDHADLSLIAPRVRDAENVEIRAYRAPRAGDLGAASGDADLLARAEHYQAWIHRQDLDVYHATAPLLLQGPPLVNFDACPMVATFYDLIPLFFPREYLDPFGSHHAYMRTLGLIKRATRLLSISDTARDDAVASLGIPPERIDRAWPFPDEVFRVLPGRLLAKLLLGVASRVRLPRRYILTVSHLHYSKNLATLMRGYAQLPQRLRTALPLVACCHLDPDQMRALRSLATDIGIADDLVVTGLVTDEELCALYNQATFVVHPSRLEGFGYPVVEAMRCGTPVVTTTAPSLREVAGDAALLVDPEEPGAFAAAIAGLAYDAEAREALTARGFEHASRFNAGQLAAATLECYRRAAGASPQPEQAGRPRIAVWTPLPPQPTGIADYSAELLGGLQARCDLEVFVDGGYLPAEDLLQSHTVHHFSAFERREAQAPFDAVVYQVGASPMHHYMSGALRAHPGIVALHDLVWSNVLYSASVHDRGDAPAFHRQLTELHGDRALADLLGLNQADNAALWEFFARYPMLDPVISGSLAQVVHVASAAEELRATYPGSNPFVVPMGVGDPDASSTPPDAGAARSALKLGPDTFVAGVFGIVHPLKRVESCIAALASLRGGGPDAVDAALVVAGPIFDRSYAGTLAALARRLGVSHHVHFTGRLEPAAFNDHLAAADVVVNLRAPVHKHMSAIIMRAVAAGKPVVISDLAEWRFLPAGFCRWIPVDAGEAPALAQALRALATDPAARAQMSAAARCFYEQEGTIDLMAARYLEVIERTSRAPTTAASVNGRGAGGSGPPSRRPG